MLRTRQLDFRLWSHDQPLAPRMAGQQLCGHQFGSVTVRPSSQGIVLGRLRWKSAEGA